VLSLRNDNNLAAISFSHVYPKELHFSHALPLSSAKVMVAGLGITDGVPV